jgi:hypothetical protein
MRIAGPASQRADLGFEALSRHAARDHQEGTNEISG